MKRSNNKTVAMISCDGWDSLTLIEIGRIFGWGDNECGQLGFDFSAFQWIIIIELNDLKI
jgi:alpha-tubulin suppressor-like RCC1 family protein